VGASAASTPIAISVGLQLSDPAGAAAFNQAVSDPSSASYRHFLSAAQWESRFSPSQTSVNEVTSWLGSQGLTVQGVTPDRMTVHATGTAAQIENAFGTGLGEYRVNGQTVRRASGAVTVPGTLAGVVTGVSGIDEVLATHDDMVRSGPTAGGTNGAGTAAPSTGSASMQPPPGFRMPPGCAAFYGQTPDNTVPPYGAGYGKLQVAPCGYTPPQLQSAYGLTSRIAGGDNGHGVTVAVVDSYVSPTLYQDAHAYSMRNQSNQVLQPSQFSEQLATGFDMKDACGGNGWYVEQTLDVEAVHAMAPGAHILYVGAKNCAGGLFDSLQNVVDNGLAQIVTNSWGLTGGDLFDSAGDRAIYDNLLQFAGSTGITVLFASGDYGDNFAVTGRNTPDYPASSPYAVAVGGTSLEVGPDSSRVGEFGWSTGESSLCTTTLVSLNFCASSQLGTWLPPAPGQWNGGSGGGVSFRYPEPSWQVGVVPTALADRNMSLTGMAGRVVPDISLDADPTTGMLIGETQVFPDGTYYGEYPIGGTSLASPLFAGLLADAVQATGTSLGFIDPTLYGFEQGAGGPTALWNVVKGSKQAATLNLYIDNVDNAFGEGTIATVITDQGPEVFCGPSHCRQQNVSLTVARGYDSMTGVGSPGTGLVGALVSAAKAPPT
jgi:subtilase family serine protease